MSYSRPDHIPYPRVWHTFEATSKAGQVYIMKVQDITEDMFDEAVTLMAKHFTADEPPCKYMGINKYPSAVENLKNLWRKCLPQRLSLVCVTEVEGKQRVVGLNILAVASKDDLDEPFQTDDPIWAQLYGAVDLVARGADIFKMYEVDRYLTAYGLIVVPEYRGMKIGTEILRARIPLCKALGISVTATVFTAAASQIVAEKAGFVTLYQISYAELAKKGFVFPGIEESTRYSKLMALKID